MSKRNFEAVNLISEKRGFIYRKRERTLFRRKVVRVDIERSLSLALALKGPIV